MIIAIDGTAASGKGTLGRNLAQSLGLSYLDTGQLYRAVGVAADAAGSGIGLAIGTIAEKVISQKEIYELANSESFLFKADAAYMSFATPGASNTELGISDGIHFNIDKH